MEKVNGLEVMDVEEILDTVRDNPKLLQKAEKAIRREEKKAEWKALPSKEKAKKIGKITLGGIGAVGAVIGGIALLARGDVGALELPEEIDVDAPFETIESISETVTE